jgi:Arc/MetJ family transcription regulator
VYDLYDLYTFEVFMRTNIDIDDGLMAAAMEAGGFKTKKEAVEEGLRLLKRKKAYAALLAARGTLFWDDSDEAWAKAREEQQLEAVVQEPSSSYGDNPDAQGPKPRTSGSSAKPRARSKAA